MDTYSAHINNANGLLKHKTRDNICGSNLAIDKPSLAHINNEMAMD